MDKGELKQYLLIGEQYYIDKHGWLYKYHKSKEAYKPLRTRLSRFASGNCSFEIGTEKKKYSVEFLKEEYARI